MIRRIGVVSKPERDDIPGLLRYLRKWCGKRAIELVADQVTSQYLGRSDGLSRQELPVGCDLIVVLGGDGTLLSAARGVGDRQIPVLAVNLGGLGFMMTTGPDELPRALRRVERSAYELDSRMALEASLVRNGATLEKFFALNDVVIANGVMARVLHLEAYADGQYVCGYTADGLILSTPTGSTAYSLSAGGPVMAPSVEALSLTPICPHTIANRTVVLPATASVEIRASSNGEEHHLSVDGQVGRSLQPEDRLLVRKASHTVDIVHTSDMGYFDLLRSKMRWGDR